MKETGSIKFNCNWTKAAPLDESLIADINKWRDRLYQSGLIGVNEDGIGFGNISARYQNNTFIISGSGTGKLEKLTGEHYTLVTEFNLDENSIVAIGPVLASSESLTHAAIYTQCMKVNAVIHVHNLALWKELLLTNPCTNPAVEYGTPAMAREVKRLLGESTIPNLKIFAMAGHDEGVVAFGKDLDEAGQVLYSAMHNG